MHLSWYPYFGYRDKVGSQQQQEGSLAPDIICALSGNLGEKDGIATSEGVF